MDLRGIDFRHWAEWGSSFYGDDPWFFLRELAQNSRDAGARHIEVESAESADRWQRLSFTDDGRGMSREHARKYLFRLYASSKEGNPDMAGQYGIGFWSILRYRPDEIVIASHDGREGWALALGADLTPREVSCPLVASGTRIVLSRPGRGETASFPQEVRAGLDRYCRHLRTAGRHPAPLSVTIAGVEIHRELSLPGFRPMSFSAPGIRGVVGLAPTPEVTVLARGLPVFHGRTLNELSHPHQHSAPDEPSGQGLAPVFLIDGDRLDATFSRQALVDNGAMRKMLAVAGRARQRLLQSLLRRARGDGEGRRERWFCRRGSLPPERAWRRGVILLSLLIALGFAVSRLILPRFLPRPAAEESPFWGQPRYRGPSEEGTAAPPAGFRYHPETAVWFRLFAADTFDPVHGWVRPEPSGLSPTAMASRASSPGMRVALPLTRAGDILLPCPVGSGIVPGSPALDGKAVPSPLRLGTDASWSIVAQAPGLLTYDCAPAEADSPLPTPPATLPWPEPLRQQLAEFAHRPAEVRAQSLRSWVASLWTFDPGPEAARAWRDDKGRRSFLDHALALRRGDCDVINGVLALALAQTGLPARLAIGFRGEAGRASGSLHAWAEYRFHDSWRPLDATIPTFRVEAPPSIAAPPPTAAAPAGSSGWLLLLPLCAGALAWGWLARRPRFTPAADPSPEGSAEPHLAELVRGVLNQRQAWQDRSTLFHTPLLPSLDGRKLSIARCMALARRGLLLSARPHHLDRLGLQGSRVPILAAGDSPSQELIPLLPGVYALDDLLGSGPPQPVSPGLRELFFAVNRLLRRAGPGWPHLVVGEWTGPGRVRALDLSRLAPRELGHRGRYFLLKNGDEGWTDLLRTFAANRPLACHRLLRELWSASPPLVGATPSFSRCLVPLLEGENPW
ncbi:MAG TPA: ATP-binding protein [Candidatus Aminicenantes bacterium]|nr:ATP-binding protein [Candidatus Aminicenantes bacterium]